MTLHSKEDGNIPLSLHDKIREIVDAVEENGAIPFKGEKKYIEHLTVDQATAKILSAFKECLTDRLRHKSCTCLSDILKVMGEK
jgi:hypothetical protein